MKRPHLIYTHACMSFLDNLSRLAPSLSRMGFDRVYPVYYEISFELKRRTRETCKTRHSLIFTGQNPVRWRHNNKISRGVGSTGVCKNAKYNLPWRIYKTTDKYFNYGKKGYRFCEIGLMLYNLSVFYFSANGIRKIRCILVYISFRFYMKRFSLYRMMCT
jgi:hypothetical protein